MSSKRTNSAFTLIEIAVVILIIGLVIAGVITADRLISKTRIAAAQSLTKNSPITSTPDTLFWLESSMTTSFESNEASDGTSLSIWKDNGSASGVKNDAVAGSSSPTYANTINRIHASKFSGGQHFVINGSALNNTNYSIVVVEKRLSNSSNNYFIGDPAVTTDNQTLLLGYSTNNKIIHSQGTSNSYTSNVENYEDSSGKPRILIFTSSPAGKKTYINGILAASSDNTSRLNDIGNLVIGKAYNGEIGEIAAFSRALNEAERSDIETYLAKKYEIKKYSGSCINGTVKIGAGCTYDTCSISALGSSSTSVNSGSGAINCDQPGYGGTVSYDCTMGIGSVSGTCSCASGYTLSSGSCIKVCSVSVTGSSTTSILSGASAISCNQTGYTGTVANSCSSSNPTISGTCDCDTGYTSSSGTCARICAVSVVGSSTTSTTAGASAIACNQTGYTGTVANSCSTSGTTVTGTCGCAADYSLSGGVCVGSCSVSVTGSSTTSVTIGGPAISCNQSSYTGTVANSCSVAGGTVSGTCTAITCNVAAASGFASKTGLTYAASATTLTSPCQAGYTASTPAPTYTCTVNGSTVTPTGSCVSSTCSVSIAGSSSTSVSAGSGSINCTQTGYTGTVSYTCISGVFTPSRAMCACSSKYRESSGACVAGNWTIEAFNNAKSFRWNYSGAITAGTQFSNSTATCDKAHDGLLVYVNSSRSTSGITMNNVSGWANCFCYTPAGCSGCSGSTHWGGAISSSSTLYGYKCNYP